MATEITIGIAGAAGDGLDRTGDTLARTAARLGLHLYTYNSYQSLIRGGHTWLRLRLSEEKVDNHGDSLDLLMSLNQDGIERHAREVESGGAIVFNGARLECDPVLVPKGVALAPLPVPELIAKLGRTLPVMQNTAALGALLHLVGFDIEVAVEVLDETFKKKGQAIIDQNVGGAARGLRLRRSRVPAARRALELHPQAPTRGDGQPDDRARGGGRGLEVLLGLPDEPSLVHPALAGGAQRAVRRPRQAGRRRAGGRQPGDRGRTRRRPVHVRHLRWWLRPDDRSDRHGGHDRGPGRHRERPARRPLDRPAHEERAGRPAPGVRCLAGGLPPSHRRAARCPRLLPHIRRGPEPGRDVPAPRHRALRSPARGASLDGRPGSDPHRRTDRTGGVGGRAVWGRGAERRLQALRAHPVRDLAASAPRHPGDDLRLGHRRSRREGDPDQR